MDVSSSYRTMRATPQPRSSLRSRESSSTITNDPREKIKDCCRKFVAFMCTQVGVGGLVVGYAIVGALGFVFIERDAERPEIQLIAKLRIDIASKLWTETIAQNVFDEPSWRNAIDKELYFYQTEYLKIIKNKNYDERSSADIWSFPAALMFSLSIFTMIGYGNIVPRTDYGRGLTVAYAVFGIPLYVLYFMNMGKILASTFRWLYTRLYKCGRGGIDSGERVIVPSTACLWVIGGYILAGSIIFSVWEKWDYLDSVYYCVTSLCKIGLGDFVPGTNVFDSQKDTQTKLIINFVYILLGMGLIAMCYNLMREEVRVRVQVLKENCRQYMDNVQYHMVACTQK